MFSSEELLHLLAGMQIFVKYVRINVSRNLSVCLDQGLLWHMDKEEQGRFEMWKFIKINHPLVQLILSIDLPILVLYQERKDTSAKISQYSEDDTLSR